MAIAFVASGAVATGTTSLSVPYPAGLSSGDLLLLAIGNKYPANAPSVPSGWTQLAQGSGGAGASGADSGQVYSTVMYKAADGSETGNLSVTLTSSNSCIGRMFCYSNATGAWDLAAVTDDDTVASTTMSFAFASNHGVEAGDFIVAASVANGTSATFSSPSFTQSGVTFGAITERQDSGTTLGDNIGLIVYETSASSGTASGNPSHQFTANTAFGNYPAGACVFARLRESAGGGGGFQAAWALNCNQVIQ